jgi:predicted GIY-YIG superfamily endonuclease
MFVYLLICSDNSTYIGATVNLERRLRQHNKELTGGATRTGSKVNKGLYWSRVCYVSQFPDWQATLQFEWRWKHISRQYSSKLFPLERRMLALVQLLSLEQSTSKAIPFVEWKRKPTVHVEEEYVTRCAVYLTACENLPYEIGDPVIVEENIV